MMNGINDFAAALRDFLTFQGELGLIGLDVSADLTQPTELAAISKEIENCTKCKLFQHRTHIVFGTGNPKSRLLFLGEGPGRDEDLQGEPFVGAAGQLLNRMIFAMGLKRSEVYIANIVKCRPPNNRDPEPDEIAACLGFLQAQIRAIQPETIILLGRVAAQTILGESTPISRLRGIWREYQGVSVMPTFHPAYLLRNPTDKRLAWHDLQLVMKRLNLGLPG
ncbi:MAG: uracil-DNA glycosylase [Deltaproteobacteria bacterium]|nr:uracil-DNA glycosylase [Deltaproteobacteria bacterium]